MTKWEDAYKTFPWYKQNRAYTLNCFKEGDVPLTPITGGPLTKTGTYDAIAVMVIYFGNSEQVKSRIFKVLKAAGGRTTKANPYQESQTSLRKMARTLPDENYIQVKTEFIALCEELLEEDQKNKFDEPSDTKEKLGLWNLLKRFFFRIK